MFWMRVSRRAGASPQINNEMEMMKIKTPSTILSLRDISISVFRHCQEAVDQGDCFARKDGISYSIGDNSPATRPGKAARSCASTSGVSNGAVFFAMISLTLFMARA